MTLELSIPAILIVAGIIFILAASLENVSTEKFGIRVFEPARVPCFAFGTLLLYIGLSSTSIIEFNLRSTIFIIIFIILLFFSYAFLLWLGFKVNKKIFNIVIIFASIILIYYFSICAINIYHEQKPIIYDNIILNSNNNNQYYPASDTANSNRSSVVERVSFIVSIIITPIAFVHMFKRYKNMFKRNQM